MAASESGWTATPPPPSYPVPAGALHGHRYPPLFKEPSLSSIDIVGLKFRELPAGHGQEIEAICGITPASRTGRNEILVREEIADQPLATYDPHLVRMLDNQCRQRLDRLWTGSLAGRVRHRLHGELGLVASLDEVARDLALSLRSLRRKLDQEGTSFRILMEEERQQIGLQLLANPAKLVQPVNSSSSPDRP